MRVADVPFVDGTPLLSPDDRSERTSFDIWAKTKTSQANGGSADETITTMASKYIQRQTRGILEQGAMLFVWVIGIWVLIKLLEEFKSALKPLILAALCVAILETVVQFIERIFWKSGIIASLCMRKLFLIARIAARECWQWLCNAIRKLCGKEEHQYPGTAKQNDIKELRKWDRARLPWHGMLAGQNICYRVLSVVLTLLLVTLLVFFMQSVFASNLAQMIENLNGYKDQLLKILVFCNDQLHSLPSKLTFMTKQQQAAMRKEIDQWQQQFDPQSVVASVEGDVLTALNALLTSTQSFLYELLFFILYCFLWLFSPVHINPNSAMSQAYAPQPLIATTTQDGQSRSKLSGFQCTVSQVMDQFHNFPSTNELQEHLYTIMWEYCRLKITVNTLFALSSYCLLEWCHLDLAGLVAVSTFFLSFIPELGTIICIIIPVPLIIFAPPHALASAPTTTLVPNANPFPDWDYRFANLLKALIGMSLLKLVISNLLEPWIMGRSPVLSGAVHKGQRVEETHPVIVLFAVVVCGQIWDTVGMLISVPVISVIRLTFNVWNDGLRQGDVSVA